MTRINTNVPSLVAQNRLQASNKDLQTSLTRLSTGLRINSGSDDPAGLIASEALRSEITSLNKSISNTQRASQIISTADSALGQVSSLLNDVRGLVVEAANSGALSADEVAANQLQVDSSLEAINRIAQTTTFQGRKLLDGSLDFITTKGTGAANIASLQIDQASLGSTGSVGVTINVATAATQASVDITGFTASVPGVAATGSLSIGTAVTGAAATGDVTIGTDTITVTADATGAAGNVAINFLDAGASGATTAAINGTTGALEVSYDFSAATTSADIQTAIDGLAGYSATGAGAASTTGGTAATDSALTGGVTASTVGTIAIAADAAGTAGNVAVNFIDGGASSATTAAINGTTGALEVTYDFAAATAASAITSAIDGLAGYSATLTGSGNTTAGTAATAGALTLGTNTTPGGVQADVVFELAGKNGSEVFNVTAGTSLNQVISQINLVSDATGVTAASSGTTLQLRSSAYGTDAIVDLRILTQGSGGNFGTGTRDIGSDIVATVNGRSANGVGNKISINSATLDLKADLVAGFTGDASITITGGGALFQLGGEVVGNQQARVGIGSVNSARLGGVAGKLYQLGSGESASLSTNPTLASQIVSEAIDQVTGLRGRLGAFQATTLESNSQSLSNTVANLQEAESSIRDADFATETANLTRAQILVQSGTSVLSIAKQNPQNVLSLLR